MKNPIRPTALCMAVLLGLALEVRLVCAQPFGGAADSAYAAALWQALVQARLAGPQAMESKPYPGQHPHGAVLQTWESQLSVAGQSGAVIVKRNYGGEDVSTLNVSENPSRYLQSVTVMYQRPGYDPENKDWFWAKYLPDGELDNNPQGTPLAGRIGKGGSQGCIPCHSAAPGGDRVFTNNRY